MKVLCSIFLLLFLSTSHAQEIMIYHGVGHSTVIENKARAGSTKEYRFDVGDKVTITVVNAHPGFYKYEFITKDYDIEDPSIPEIPSALTDLLSNTQGIVSESKESANRRKDAGKDKEWAKAYQEKIEQYKKMLAVAEEIIKNSDEPGNIEQAITSSAEVGFTRAVIALQRTDLFAKINDIDKDVTEFMQKVKSAQAPYYYIPEEDKPEIELLMQLYDNYLKTLGSRAKQIRTTYASTVSSTKSMSFVVEAKKEKRIALKITKKLEKGLSRQVGDTVVFLKVIPNFNRPTVELVPVAIMASSGEGKKFGIENGLVTVEDDENEFQLGVGALLQMNIINFGKKKEMSFAVGGGFALVDEEIGNYFISGSFNFGSAFRVGAGYGWLRTATGLKNNLVAGSNASNIPDISDQIEFTRQRAFFLTIVFPGLSIPLLK